MVVLLSCAAQGRSAKELVAKKLFQWVWLLPWLPLGQRQDSRQYWAATGFRAASTLGCYCWYHESWLIAPGLSFHAPWLCAYMPTFCWYHMVPGVLETAHAKPFNSFTFTTAYNPVDTQLSSFKITPFSRGILKDLSSVTFKELLMVKREMS